uniref:Uncharacterized protein n=1 Tax=Meloidogyne incognita TaxID=6306 RepID=A0A914L9W4_MELIC
MVSAAVIARAFVANQQEASRRAALAVEAEENKIKNGGITLIDHLRVAARASVAGSTRRETIRRTQSMKSTPKSPTEIDVGITRTASSSTERNPKKKKKKKKGFLEFGPLRFISSPKDEGKRLRPTTTSLQRQDTIGIQKPGLRAMLYGLTLKMEREEKLQKKLTRKREVLEVLKTATNRTKYGGMPDDDIKRDCWGRGTTTDDEYYQINHGGGNRHFIHTVGPVESSSGSISAVNSLRRTGFVPPHHHSTGNLATPFSRKSQRRMALRRKIQWERLSPAAIQRQIVQVQEEKAMLQAPTAPISAAKFVAYVQERRKKRILFKGEFLMIQRSVDPQRLTTEVGIRMGEKNQYPDTLPYDQNRVILEHRPGVEDSHYINASYVNSWLRERAYVVTQSVRNKQASNEFWRCVWEIGANTIVMLTKIFDFMRVVCLQYWPQTQFQFGEIHVETLDTRTYAHFVIRTFRLRKTGGVGDLTTTTSTDVKGEAQRNINDNSEERIVKHFHFTEWELNSFPYISAFVEVRRRVRQWMERSPVDSPIVVHCSNGGGRSGAFLAVDANLELLQRTGQLDVFEYARTLINSRQNLISSVEQYTFIYDVLCEAVLCNVQPMAMHQLKDRSTMYKARKNRELMELQDSHENKLLTMLTAPLRIGDCAGGHRLENRGKNRDVMVVPPDHARPYLQTLHGESKDYTYINAVEVDGFTRKAEFIVTEWPKQQTLDSFWTLVFDHNVHTTYPPFVHNKGKRNYGPFTIEIVNFQQYPGLCSYMVKLSKRPMEEVVERRKWQRERERPLSDGALLPEQEILMKISVSDAHRPKRDERGRRLGGEWDKSQSTRSRQSSKSRKSHKYRGSNRGSSKRRRKRRERRFSEPNLGTLERFEKPTNAPMPLLMPVEKPVGNKKLCGTEEIKQLLNVKRAIPTRRDLAEQMEKLTFMISEIMATGASQQQLEAEVRLCCIIQVKMWPIENKVPLSTTALIEVLKMTRSWRKRAPDRPESRPTIVMSHNGVSRCGIFIAANVLIDQMEMDHEVDVFHAVKLIRLNRPQLIDGPRTRFTGDAKDEYKYLYDLMLHWYMTNPELRSFEPPEADSLGSDDGSSDESIGESQSLGTNRRSIRSGNTRSIQRSKSSRASRRTITTANSLVHGGTEIGGTTTQRNSNETSNEQKKRMEPVYLN